MEDRPIEVVSDRIGLSDPPLSARPRRVQIQRRSRPHPVRLASMPQPTLPGPPRIAKLGLAMIAGWWVLQAVLIGSRAGEPYPAIIMPSFPGSGGYDHGEVRLSRMEAEFVEAGGGKVVTQRRLRE